MTSKKRVGRSWRGLVKSLEQVALVVGVDEDAEVLDAGVVFLDGGVAVVGEHLVVDASPDLSS
ncbi:MAG: hypothetical protein R3B46_10405 [Phycisphaerales bacterium]